jgi:hypothetical protein
VGSRRVLHHDSRPLAQLKEKIRGTESGKLWDVSFVGGLVGGDVLLEKCIVELADVGTNRSICVAIISERWT